jgi:hypothetical protein
MPQLIPIITELFTAMATDLLLATPFIPLGVDEVSETRERGMPE